MLTFHELPEHGDVTDWLAGRRNARGVAGARRAGPEVCRARIAPARRTRRSRRSTGSGPGVSRSARSGCSSACRTRARGSRSRTSWPALPGVCRWPCDEGQAPLGNVVLFTAEDDINDTIVPRLMAAGADLAPRAHLKMMREAGKQRMFSLISDLEALRRKVVEIGDVRMIIIDPITAYLGIGKIDSFRATDVRAVLGPLKEFAAELRLSILGVMHFNKKIDITNVLLRISDSLAYGAAARHVYGVSTTPTTTGSCSSKARTTWRRGTSRPWPSASTTREVGTDKKTGAPIRAPYIVWHPEPVDITAIEAMQAAADPSRRARAITPSSFSRPCWATGRLRQKVHEAAKENGVSRMTLRRRPEGRPQNRGQKGRPVQWKGSAPGNGIYQNGRSTAWGPDRLTLAAKNKRFWRESTNLWARAKRLRNRGNETREIEMKKLLSRYRPRCHPAVERSSCRRRPHAAAKAESSGCFRHGAADHGPALRQPRSQVRASRARTATIASINALSLLKQTVTPRRIENDKASHRYRPRRQPAFQRSPMPATSGLQRQGDLHLRQGRH